MALTVNDIVTQLNTYVGDSSTDRITAAQRFQYITEACQWLQEETSNDHTINSYDISYVDTVYYYQVSNDLATFLDGADLRRPEGHNQNPFLRKSSKEMSVDIGNDEPAFGIDWSDGFAFAVINNPDAKSAFVINSFNTVGNWTADTVNSDATNVVSDTVISKDGSGSLSFDLSVSQSANNRATIIDSSDTYNLAAWKNAGVFLLDVDIPNATYITSFTLKYGTSNTVYFSNTVTTTIDGLAFAAGWQTLAFEWAQATPTGSPTSTISYLQIDMNYSVTQGNATNFRYDNLRVALPETLSFFYQSDAVGKNNAGSTILSFTATTDVPYFSGQQDNYKYAVAHKAASICFDNLRLKQEALIEENRAAAELKRKKKLFPTVKMPEVRSFKIRGMSLNK